jgi:tRNA G18 (ribose-2'-O)-methylase SpoU
MRYSSEAAAGSAGQKGEKKMRGYFGVGVEGISKGGNLGNLVRTSHAFGASFFFTIAASVSLADQHRSDTSKAEGHMPFYAYPDLAALSLPKDCTLVGVELTDDAVDLPRFAHPLRAAYVLGPEKGSLSPALTAACKHIVKIPTKFCVNVGIAGAIVIYDRMISLGDAAETRARNLGAGLGKL